MKSWKQYLKETITDFVSLVRILTVGTLIIVLIIANSSVEQNKLASDIFNSDHIALKIIAFMGLASMTYVVDSIIVGLLKIIWFLLKIFKNKIWK